MKNRQQDAVTDRHIADVEIAAPFALAIDAGGHLPIGRHADGADKGRDRPGNALVEMENTVAKSAARSRRVAEDLGGVIRRQFRPAGGLPQRSALGPDGDPRVFAYEDVFDRYRQSVAAL